MFVDEFGIEAEPFYGEPVWMGWDDVAVRQEDKRTDPFRGVFVQVRLVGRDGSRIVLDGEITNSAELFEEVRAKTPHTSSGLERRWWERVVRPG